MLVASGHAPDAKVRKALEAGGGRFIFKPFLLPDLMERVRTALDERKEIRSDLNS